MDLKVKNKVPRELTRGLFNPEYIPKDTNLNDFIREAAAPAEQEITRKRVVNRTQNPSTAPSGVPIPITEAEAVEADLQITNTLQRIAAARNKLTDTRKQLDEAVNTYTNGKELNFKINVKKKPRVRRALRKLYGENLSTITYSMYKEMLKAKAELEKQEVKDYAAGKQETT